MQFCFCNLLTSLASQLLWLFSYRTLFQWLPLLLRGCFAEWRSKQKWFPSMDLDPRLILLNLVMVIPMFKSCLGFSVLHPQSGPDTQPLSRAQEVGHLRRDPFKRLIYLPTFSLLYTWKFRSLSISSLSYFLIQCNMKFV